MTRGQRSHEDLRCSNGSVSMSPVAACFLLYLLQIKATVASSRVNRVRVQIEEVASQVGVWKTISQSN